MASQTTLRRHLQRQHICSAGSYPSFTVDTLRGIYLVAKTDRGLAAPVHVQKNSKTQTLFCTDATCKDILHAASEINPGMECKHMQAVQSSTPGQCESLDEKAVSEFHEMKIICKHSSGMQ